MTELRDAGSKTTALGSPIQIDEGKAQTYLDEVVRSTMAQDAERAAGCGRRSVMWYSEVYEHREERKGTREQLGTAGADQNHRSQPKGIKAAQRSV